MAKAYTGFRAVQKALDNQPAPAPKSRKMIPGSKAAGAAKPAAMRKFGRPVMRKGKGC